MKENNYNNIGVVVIGRNEGKRLIQSIESLLSSGLQKIVYVDSDSSDGSLQNISDLGVTAVPLDLSKPFTAGRARNFGFSTIIEQYPELIYIQFIDGDCLLEENWLDHAQTYLEDAPQSAIVCGRRKEEYPDASLYNYMCDIEWDLPLGIVRNCGGDFLVRREVFEQFNGFDETVIAGEEPELCARLRAAGWEIYRYDALMTFHDAKITRFKQWWLRTIRSGFSHTAAMYRNRSTVEFSYYAKICTRTLLWTSVYLAFVFLLFISSTLASLAGLLIVVRYFRIYSNNRSLKKPWGYSFLLAICCIPETIGMFKFLTRLMLNKKTKIIEYK